MNDFLSLVPHIEFVAALGLLYAAFHRLTNTALSLKWESKTVAPEPAEADVKRLTTERDHYKSEAEQFEAQLKQRTGTKAGDIV